MSYVDGFVMVTKNPKAYRAMAKGGAKLWKKYGALAYYECFGDDLRAKHVPLSFPKLMKAKRGETVIFSVIIYKSKAHRDAVNKKVMADPIMNDPKWVGKAMPFDLKRMAMGGFKVVVEA
ncbi:MAG TPA: DUF1428 domain-containing protein [Patescibacteria group bacterium]|nr:DUF1428 domain-containing protein [Patescibacteria group bacterium]